MPLSQDEIMHNLRTYQHRLQQQLVRSTGLAQAIHELSQSAVSSLENLGYTLDSIQSQLTMLQQGSTSTAEAEMRSISTARPMTTGAESGKLNSPDGGAAATGLQRVKTSKRKTRVAAKAVRSKVKSKARSSSVAASSKHRTIAETQAHDPRMRLTLKDMTLKDMGRIPTALKDMGRIPTALPLPDKWDAAK
jgi:hypothetical protein